MTDAPAGLLAGKVAIVTGASSGIGRATAQAFAEAGAHVVVTGRREAAVRAAAAEHPASSRTCMIVGDLTSSSFCEEVASFAEQEFGRVDVLANVAGVITRGDVTRTSDEEWRLNMAVNVDAVFFMSRAVVPRMRSAGAGGAIVNLASNVGLVGSAGLPAYCASKGAVVLLTKAMALDHATEGIRVNALCPGAVDTPMLVSGHDKTGRTPDEVFASNIASIPEGRVPRPEEIAKSMVFLASDASSHITGVALPIDGGYVAQ